MTTDEVKRIYKESVAHAKRSVIKHIHTEIRKSAETNSTTVYITGDAIDTIKKFNIMDYVLDFIRSEGFKVEAIRKYSRDPVPGYPEPFEKIEIRLYDLFCEVITEVKNEDAKRK